MDNAQRQTILWVMMLMVPLGPLAVNIFLGAFQEMASFFQVGEAKIQLSISIFMISLGLGQLVTGYLSDLYGRRFSALAGLGIYGGGSLLAAYAPDLTSYYAGRVLQGVGSAFCAVSAMAWIRESYSADRAGNLISYIGGLNSIVPMFAPLAGGLLLQFYGWQASFELSALLAFALFAAVFALVPKKAALPAAVQAKSSAPLSVLLKQLFTHPDFVLFNLVGMFGMVALLGYMAVASTVATDLAGLSQLHFSLLYGLIGGVLCVTSLLGPKLAALLGRKQAVLAGTILNVIAGMGMLFIPANLPLVFFIFAAIGSAGFGFMMGLATGMAIAPFKHCAGLAASMNGVSRMVGGGVLAAGISALELAAIPTAAVGFLLMLAPLIGLAYHVRQPQALPEMAAE